MELERPEPFCLEFATEAPFDWGAKSLVNWGMYHPYEFAGWEEETLSWKENCYLHAGLGFCLPIVDIIGKDIIPFFTKYSVNSFNDFPVGAIRHVVMCNKFGNIMAHGLAVRVDEYQVRTVDLAPYISYLVSLNEFDVKEVDCSKDRFIFQVAGPKSLEILENAAEEDLHDISFMRSRSAKIAGQEVDILRVGMAGTIAYEVHGIIEISHDVYNKIVEVGENYDLHKLGTLSYVSNHTENGFPQHSAHFALAWIEDEGMSSFASQLPPVYNDIFVNATGTYSNDPHSLFRNPIELGWSNIVKFNHDFLGREALEKIASNPKRKVVTLKWNAEDVVDIFRSYLQEEGPTYKFMPWTVNYQSSGDFGNDYAFDKVTVRGETIGSSSWYVYTKFYKSVISMGVIDMESAQIGNEVIIHWGFPEGPIKQIRATVERFPYLDLVSNKNYDIESIPRYSK